MTIHANRQILTSWMLRTEKFEDMSEFCRSEGMICYVMSAMGTRRGSMVCLLSIYVPITR